MLPSRSPATRTASPRFAIGLVVDRWDWHARALGKALAALGAQVAAVRLPECGFDTQGASGLSIPGFPQLPDAVMVRTMSGGTLRGGDDAARRAACAARARRHGVERRPRDRALRRQVDDELPACARGNSDARDLGDAIPRGGARDRAARGGARSAGAQAAVRLAGKRPAADRPRGRIARARRGRRRLLPATLHGGRARGLPRFPPARVAGPRHRRDGAPCAGLDHERQARRPADRGRGGRRAEGPRRAGNRGGRRGVRRRGYSLRPRRAPDGARGQQHAGLGGGCRRWCRSISRRCSRAIWSRRSPGGRSARKPHDRRHDARMRRASPPRSWRRAATSSMRRSPAMFTSSPMATA